MFPSENSYTYALLAALTVAVFVTFVSLVHALRGSYFFW